MPLTLISIRNISAADSSDRYLSRVGSEAADGRTERVTEGGDGRDDGRNETDDGRNGAGDGTEHRWKRGWQTVLGFNLGGLRHSGVLAPISELGRDRNRN